MDPAGKVAVVTGGNSGLGEAAALRLAAVGATVVTLDRDGEAPGGLTTIACNVSSEASVTDAVAQVIDRHIAAGTRKVERELAALVVDPVNGRFERDDLGMD